MSKIKPPSAPLGTKAKAKQGKSSSDKKLEEKYASLLEDSGHHNPHDAGEDSGSRKRKRDDDMPHHAKKDRKDNAFVMQQKKEDLRNRSIIPRRDPAVLQRRRVDASKNIRPMIDEDDDEYTSETDNHNVEMEAFFGERQNQDEIEDEEDNWEDEQEDIADEDRSIDTDIHIPFLDVPTDIVLESGFERNKKIISLLEDFSHRPQEDWRPVQDIEDEKALIKEVLEKMFKQAIDGMQAFTKDMRQHYTFGRVANLCKHALSALAHNNIADAKRLVKIILPKKG